MPFQYATATETRIAKAIVTAALAKGWKVSVHDGEEFALKQSTDKAAIYEAMNSTDSDTLRFRNAGGVVGSVMLIWGNDEDLLSDHSDNEVINVFVEEGRFY